MAKKKKKGIFKKILKGVGIAAAVVGTIYTGGAAAGLVGGALKLGAGAAKGTGALAKIGGAAKGLFNRGKKLKDHVTTLVTGKTKQVRQILKEEKVQAKAAKQKIEDVKDLMEGGLTLEEAKSKLGISDEMLPGESAELGEDVEDAYTGATITDKVTEKQAGFGSSISSLFTKEKLPWLLGIAAAIMFLPRILKKL